VNFDIGQLVWICTWHDNKAKHGLVIDIVNNDCRNRTRNADRDYVILVGGDVLVWQDYKCFASFEELQRYESMAHGINVSRS
jgi:hypothetical protein